MGAGEVKEPLYVCIHVPEFPAQAMMRLRPHLAQVPVVVLAGEPPLQQVCSANAKAYKLGVMQGMTRAELDSFTGISILRRSEAEERSARIALLEAAGKFTPRIEVQPCSSSAFIASSDFVVASAFVVALDMTGTTLIFGSASQAISSMIRVFGRLRFFVHLAASANLHTAVCLASSSRKQPVLVPAGREAEHLRQLPLDALPLMPRQAEVLSLWGLHTLGDLAALPEVELVVRLGQQGKRLRLLARGEHPHLLVPEEPAFTLEEFIALEEPVELLDSLLFVLGPMLDQLLARAQNHAYALATVTVKLGLDGGGEHERTITPALPVMHRDVLLKLLHLDLQAHPPPAGVVSFFVHAEPGNRSKVQLGLFTPQLPEPLRLDVTLARIAALVGEQRVGRAQLMDTHRPESFTMERFVVPPSRTAESAEARPRAIAALRRCRPPVPVAVRHDGHRLAGFTFHGTRYVVQEAYGPWRRSGEWWAASVWSREEWDVRASVNAEDGLLCVLTHDLLHHHWQMEGFYD